ncbi:phosphate butyryltransferase [Thermanaerosceptrum fracticalcis]|uniref:Phosphate butyryltransferase n=1 Tax=Thermanaerosceptrum fracticalcis TaxID=1712410 RepID=A0A7G6E753_THEFR|nr:phosphate butyryltransferase [Thermanaerosceptrum fracticalcis]QNB47907.1 phosphate butyryltransferase [Thermanaerosceptrum fracticalcis]
MRSFQEIKEAVLNHPVKKVIAVAAADDEDVLVAVKMASQMKLAEPILIGNEVKIREIADEVAFDLTGVKVIDEPDQFQAARKAVRKIREGEAHIIMKGLIGTAPFLKAILEKDVGLRTGNVLSHVALFEVPHFSRLLLVTDAAMNIAPTLPEKVQIIQNALQVTKKLKISQPKTAAVCAVETVNQDMPATVDAALLAKMSERGQIKGTIIDGPLALDNAVSLEAARHKGIKSPVAGEADIIIVPDIEAGNIMYKTLVYLANADNAGVVMGALAPIVLTSRADTAEAKLNSIALSMLLAQGDE